MKRILITVLFALPLLLPRAVAAADMSWTSKVVLVRGSKMTICPFDGYTAAQKARIADNQPVYSPNEYMDFHPNPVLNSETATGCLEMLYGQLEFVPFGKEPTYIPSEYIYSVANRFLREDKVVQAKPSGFSDEKLIYKKVTAFRAIDDLTGATVTVPNTLFWFRGSEVYGKIGDVKEGVILYNGTYYRMDGNQMFMNHVVLWTNPNGAPSGTPPPVTPTPTPEVVTVSVTPQPIPTYYQSGINWKSIAYDTTVEDTLGQNDLQSWLNPPGRVKGYKLELPGNLASAQGLTAQLKSCGDAACTTHGFDEIMFVMDRDGRRLDMGWQNTRMDLNTEYFRTNRTVYLLVGSMNAPDTAGSTFYFYWGPGTLSVPSANN